MAWRKNQIYVPRAKNYVTGRKELFNKYTAIAGVLPFIEKNLDSKINQYSDLGLLAAGFAMNSQVLFALGVYLFAKNRLMNPQTNNRRLAGDESDLQGLPYYDNDTFVKLSGDEPELQGQEENLENLGGYDFSHLM